MVNVKDNIGDVVDQTIRHELDSNGYVFFSVSGSCMEPVIMNNVRIQVAKSDALHSGDIVAYQTPADRIRYVHRLLGRLRVRGKIKYVFMPDNASFPDMLVSPTQILGRVLTIEGEPVKVTKFKKFVVRLRYCIALFFIVKGKFCKFLFKNSRFA